MFGNTCSKGWLLCVCYIYLHIFCNFEILVLTLYSALVFCVHLLVLPLCLITNIRCIVMSSSIVNVGCAFTCVCREIQRAGLNISLPSNVDRKFVMQVFKLFTCFQLLPTPSLSLSLSQQKNEQTKNTYTHLSHFNIAYCLFCMSIHVRYKSIKCVFIYNNCWCFNPKRKYALASSRSTISSTGKLTVCCCG